jgi:peptide/nickel transport system substrate-binding protein
MRSKVLLLALLLLFALVPAHAQESGGRMVIAFNTEPTTFDAHLSNSAGTLGMMGATLVARNPQTDALVPYLATGWTTSEDGLVWDFTLREDVTFHNGDPLTAEDYAWTFNRWLNPETASPTVASVSAIIAAEAVEPYTLRLTLAIPFAPLLDNLTVAYAQPLSRRAVEEGGANYGVQPVGVGPFRFKEWIPGERFVLERNPDYNWAPDFVHQGAAYLEEIEYRFIPEYATLIAGMEAGEVDTSFGSPINPRDVPLLQDLGFTLVETYLGGMDPYVLMNVAAPPFDDLRVRQAFNMAVDRQSIIQVVTGGSAIPQYGPISVSVAGYDPVVETAAPPFSLDVARALLAEAGYADSDGDGILEKDGQPFALTMLLTPDYATLAQVLQEQYRQLGVQIELQQGDMGTLFGAVVTGQYQLAISFYTYNEADIMFIFYHSSSLGAINISQVNDPALDDILIRTRTAPDPETRQAAVTEAQIYIINQAFTVPLYTPSLVTPFSPRVKGVLIGRDGSNIWLNDVTIAN